MSNNATATRGGPSPGAVSLHVARLDLEPARLAELSRTLAPDEHARAERYLLERHRRRFRAARGWLRERLAAELGVAAEALVFEYGPQGKPALGGPHAGLRFNVSHSQDLALMALSWHHELGVDVEALRPDLDTEAIASRFFSLAEREALRKLPAPERGAAFFTVWTRKEAYLKLRGGGLHLPLDGFDVSLDEPARLLRDAGDPDAVGSVALATVAVPEGFRAALAVAGGRAMERRAISRAR